MIPEQFKPWFDLLDAINICAANDVRKYLSLKKSGELYSLNRYKYNELYRNYRTAIAYFKSKYFTELNDFDGSKIVEQLKQFYK